ncbi:hypothetical protein Q3G72_016560 [Acer saccharum]|nr:hypothetical protein Q3G72_016560 [Acer saccharum]
MTSESPPAASGKQFYRDKANAVSGNRAAVEKSKNSVCAQTGEEFSSEFLRDRVAIRRVQVRNDGDHRPQTSRVGYNFNQNHQMVYEDLNGILGLRRKDSECSAEGSDFVSATGGYVAEVENKVYPDHWSRFQRQYGAIGQTSSKLPDEIFCDQVITEPMASPHEPMASPLYVMDSPQSYHPFGPGFSEVSYSGKMKFLCSFGGRILPRPNDGKLRYVGGETRIISIRKNLTWEELVRKTSAICNQSHTIKYQLPGEDLDALISVCSDEDLHHMIEEYEELERIGGTQRLRIFLVPSGESESPSSVEGRSTQQSDPGYQYVSAVNGMLDVSPQKSSSGQSVTSQTNQMGNASDYSLGFHRDSPTSAHNCENKDYSPNSSNLGSMFFNRAAHLLPALQIPSRGFNLSPPISPIPAQHRDATNSNVQFYVDRGCTDGNGSSSPYAMDKFPREHSYYLNTPSHYDNHPHGPLPLINYHQHEQYLDTDQTSKSREMHFHTRGPSGDLAHYAHYNRSDINSDKPLLKERALSDSQLQDHNESFIFSLGEGTIIPQSPCDIQSEKSPILAMSSSLREWPVQWKEMIDEKHQAAKYENHPSLITLEPSFEPSQELNWRDANPASSDQERKCNTGSVEITLYENHMEDDINYQPIIILPRQDSQESGGSLFSLQIGAGEDSAYTIREQQLLDNLVDTTPLEFRVRNASEDQMLVVTAASQSLLHVSAGIPSLPSPGVANQGCIIPRCQLTTSSFSSREDCLEHRTEKVSIGKKISDKGLISKDAIYVQSQSSQHHHENKAIMTVIVEDVTDSIPLDIPSSPTIVPLVEDDASDDYPSPRETEADSFQQASDCEDVKSDCRDVDESISDAAMAEIEAGIYGLQIIKNIDLEELKELGSGTFGTVYHGKWRGTDVAIKRIKKSCFSGRSSEQERLTKDFWREAQILSKLHHPNVVAFYGVVPDGPGGTMATVTEYMVNGSLRHVLVRKDRSLDRRRKLMIAMDAAFGMEYLHLKNIVHFDLKCDNLLVNLRDTQRPICKVGDFGLSRIKRNTLVSGGVRGTLPWMAPELLNGSSSRVSEKVDVFSFGIAMWEILTGEEPYANMHCGAIIGGIVSNTLRPPIPERCDPEWKKLMEDCWSFDPASRPSFTEITDRLRVMSMALQTKRRTPAPR